MSGPEQRSLIVGTAGHIDHGKTALIKRLTGIDTDRLQEEKERGITIDLGFAYLDLPNGTRVGIVDVPGHERFIRNMLAGATGIDFVLMIIAADAGIMPQTSEHLQICQLLNIQKGLIVVTKKDLVDDDWLELMLPEIETAVVGTFLENGPIIPVSSVTGEGIPLLIETLERVLGSLQIKPDQKIFRMPIDRAFTIKGFGTVTTGTISSGTISVGDTVTILPGDTSGRVRTLQVHHENVDQAYAGQRTAVNLHGVEKQSITRGHVLCQQHSFRTTLMIDALVTVLPDAPHHLQHRSRVHFHCGTAEIMARVVPLEADRIDPGKSGYAQIRFEGPLALIADDRFVLRAETPLQTIAGGIVLVPDALKRNRLDPKGKITLASFEQATTHEKIQLFINLAGIKGTSIETLVTQTGERRENIVTVVRSDIEAGTIHAMDRDYGYLLGNDSLEQLIDSIVLKMGKILTSKRLRSGITREELRSSFPFLSLNAFSNVLEIMRQQGRIQQSEETFSLIDHKVQLKAEEQKTYERIKKVLETRAYNVPSLTDLIQDSHENRARIEPLVRMMIETRELVLIKPNLLFSAPLLHEIIEKVIHFFQLNPIMTIADVKTLFGFSRKLAIPLLEYLDSEKITERKDDARILRVRQG